MIDERKDKLGEQSEEQVNIQELLFRYLIHWPWFVVSIIICIACAWGYLRLTTPIYNISATVLIKDEKKGGGASMSSDLEKMGLEGFISSSSNVDNEIEVLRSKSLAREVVNNLGLFVTYMDEDEFPSKELYHTSPVLVSLTHQEADKLPGRMEINMILQPTGVLGVQITVGEKEYRKQFDKLPAVFPTDEGTVAFFANNDTLSAVCPENITKERHITAFINRPFSVLKEYVNSLSIAPTSKTTSVVVISLENTNTRRGRDYINKLLEMYNINANNDKNEVAQKTAEFIDERIGIISKELGSNGSVIPRFKEQIENGGPVTVTHPDIIRFFMTIPEACRLVMEAVTMGEGNEIFVFEMGKAVKIVDLATRMIELAGYRPDEDIKIEFTGLRPGEKLYEEVLSDKENTIPTENKKIMIAKVRRYEYADILDIYAEFEKLSRTVRIMDTVRLMKKVVPEFKSKNSKFEVLDKE